MLVLSDFVLEVLSYLGSYGLMLSIGVYLLYQGLYLSQRNPLDKYEFVSAHEIKFLKWSAWIFAFSMVFFLFDFIVGYMGLIEGYEYYFIGFVSIGVGIMIGYFISEYFKVYYPFILEKKLSKIRFQPRLSPQTGKPMRLLDETEEDQYLTSKMILDEDELRFDYDVWLDEDTGYKLIEKYDVHLEAKICPQCNFRTMKDYEDKIERANVAGNTDHLLRHYKCSHCGYEMTEKYSVDTNDKRTILEKV